MNELANSQNEKPGKFVAQSNEVLIDKKIADAKLSIADRQIKFLVSFGAIAITVFGIIIPLWQSFQTVDRIDKAIKSGEAKIDQTIFKMESKFNELSGKLSQKPDISSYVDGSDLTNNIIHMSFKSNNEKEIVIENSGEGTAEFIKMRLYVDCPDDYFHSYFYIEKPIREDYFHNDDPNYKWHYVYDIDPLPFPAKDTILIRFRIGGMGDNLKEEKTIAKAYLKVFYGESTPKKIPFTIELSLK